MFVDIGIQNFDARALNHSSSEISLFRQKSNAAFNRDKLQSFLLGSENVLNAEAIVDACFPEVHADVFLSHAHRDEEDVIKLALSLEKLGLNVFVDSCVWGWADEILRVIDEEFCYKKTSQTFDYDLRNRTTSNVYMILNSALQNMIASTELLLFLQTNNSVKIGEYVKNKTHLSSPWIFSELIFAKLGQRTKRRRVKNYAFESFASDSKQTELNKSFEVAFPNPGSRYELANNELQQWIQQGYEKNISDDFSALTHLDVLYRRAGISSDELSESRLLLPPKH
ncbi:toll/interleukin-1 receptor domain-containing protein [Kosakonia sp. YIM B13605]|uniref:toll/interleukin-1 receptor domain-containing protein n=1 Tax=Enterobacterales TaxID=91347 RepID=UPI001021E6EB|nr:toll/interleukin-1 receptor domain-containing protein [Rahnella sp. CFA14(1/10)]